MSKASIFEQHDPGDEQQEKAPVNDWTVPVHGRIVVPDELYPLFNKVAFQLRFHTLSGKSEVETVADIVWIAQEFFAKK